MHLTLEIYTWFTQYTCSVRYRTLPMISVHSITQITITQINSLIMNILFKQDNVVCLYINALVFNMYLNYKFTPSQYKHVANIAIRTWTIHKMHKKLVNIISPVSFLSCWHLFDLGIHYSCDVNVFFVLLSDHHQTLSWNKNNKNWKKWQNNDSLFSH